MFGYIVLLPRLLFLGSFLALIAGGVLAGNILAGLILYARLRLSLQVLVFSLLIGVFAGSAMSVYAYHREKLERRIAALKNIEIENERLKRIDSELRLQGIQSKLDPHFLSNTLNSVAALVYEDPPRAEQALVRLAGLYRKVLAASSRTWIDLSEEMDLLRDFLELVKLRLDERLDFVLECPEGLRSERIPGLLLQPLVENAVKQAENRTDGGIAVRVSAGGEGDRIVLRVSDDGPGFDVERTSPGFGLYSVQERLRLAYGEDFGFAIRSGEGRGTEVEVRIPAGRKPGEAAGR
ncbi:MAG: histidine kinase [Candidatus Aminicenantes bacterium]|nr:histidine kinase [Candidatus Aminicenantes bacterium]